MKRAIKPFQPVFIGLIAFISYLVLYRPAAASSEIFNAGLVFFTAAIWSAVILFLEDKNYLLFFIYLGFFCVFISAGMVLIQFTPEERTIYNVLLGLITALIFFLIIFVKIYRKK